MYLITYSLHNHLI